MRLNVLDFETPRAALDAAVNGDRVYFPGGIKTYTAEAGGWPAINKSLTIEGDGRGASGTTRGTVILSANPGSPIFQLASGAHNVHFRDLQLRPGSGSQTGGSAIICSGTAAGLGFERLDIAGFSGNGIALAGTNGDALRVDRVGLIDCDITNCGGVGISLTNAFNVYMHGTRITGCAFNGVAVSGGSIALYQCMFDGNCASATDPNDGSIKVLGANAARVEGCRFVNVGQGSVRKACVVIDTTTMIGSCYVESVAAPGTTGFELGGTLQAPGVVLGNRFKQIATLIKFGSNSRQCLVLPQHDESGSGSIVYPAGAEGLFGSASISVGGGGPNNLTGLIVPPYSQDPTVSVRDGTLAYNKTQQVLKIRVAGVWRKVETL